MAKAAYIKPEVTLELYKIYSALGNGKPPSFKAFYEKASQYEQSPSESWCKKKFAEWNKKFYQSQGNPNEQDKLWTMGSLNKMAEMGIHVPPETIPLLLENETNPGVSGISIREAKWAVRLSGCFLPRTTLEEKRMAITAYAYMEKLSEIIEIPFDTAILDKELKIGNFVKIIHTYMEWVLSPDIDNKIEHDGEMERRYWLKKGVNNGKRS